MPVYEYRCTQCQKIFEYQQRMADAPRTECEACTGQLERLISRSSFSFKGGGWYKDLYSSTKPEAASSGSTSTEAKTETKTEAKTEAKTETKSSDPSTSTSTPSSGGGSSGTGSTSSSAA